MVNVLLQIKMQEARSFSPGNFFDTLLVRMDKSGDVERAITISNYNLQYDMFSADNGLLAIDEYLFFAGWSYGFQTRLQELEKDSASPDFDTYVYKYLYDHSNSESCVYEQEISSSTVARQMDKLSSSSANSELFVVQTDDSKVRKTFMQKQLFAYSSRYSGDFNLMDTMKIPRACAFKSFNLTQVDYFRGQNTKTVKISDLSNDANVIT